MYYVCVYVSRFGSTLLVLAPFASNWRCNAKMNDDRPAPPPPLEMPTLEKCLTPNCQFLEHWDRRNYQGYCCGRCFHNVKSRKHDNCTHVWEFPLCTQHERVAKAYTHLDDLPLVHMRAKLAQDKLAQPTEPPDESEVLPWRPDFSQVRPALVRGDEGQIGHRVASLRARNDDGARPQAGNVIHV